VRQELENCTDVQTLRIIHRRIVALPACYINCNAIIMNPADRAMRSATGEPSGTLRLALPGTFGRTWIAPYLSEFLTRYTQVRIHAEFSRR
jgi:hypothetical protein